MPLFLNRTGTRISLLLIFILGSCMLPARFKSRTSCEQPNIPVWVVNHGYHTSIVLPLSQSGIISSYDSAFSGYRFIEFAWGDSAYYMAEDPNAGQAFKALFLTTPSVVHVVVFNKDPGQYFSHAPVKILFICPEEKEKLIDFISASFLKNDQKKVIFIQQGNYGKSGFYRSGKKYNLFYTCNNWVVSGLRKAGLITPLWSPLSWPVMWYLPDNQK